MIGVFRLAFAAINISLLRGRKQHMEIPITSRTGVVVPISLFMGTALITTASSAIPFATLDNSSALRRTPFSSLHDQKPVPFDCESPECRVGAGAENESP